MENRTINLAVLNEVAKALAELKNDMVFVGGAVVSLYTDDEAADEIRPTADIDMTIKLASFSNWNIMQERLAQLGFYPDPFGHAICSYKYKDIPIDIMPAEDGPLGPSNRWYKWGFDNLISTQVVDEEIQILPAPCFLATKIEAFYDRGSDYRTSHDIEDVIYVLDNRKHITEEIAQTHEEIRLFIQNSLREIIDAGLLEEVLVAHIHPLMLEDRMPLMEEKIKNILNDKL